MRTLLLLTVAGLALAGCKERKPAANALDAANNGLAEGVAVTEGERALREAIRIDPKRTKAAHATGPASQVAAAKGTCLDRYGAGLATDSSWAQKLPPGFSLPKGARIEEAAGRDGKDCTIRIVSVAVPGADRDAAATWWETTAKVAGYDAGRTTRGTDLVVAGSRDDAAYIAMIGTPKGGVVPVDWVWSKGS